MDTVRERGRGKKGEGREGEERGRKGGGGEEREGRDTTVIIFILCHVINETTTTRLQCIYKTKPAVPCTVLPVLAIFFHTLIFGRDLVPNNFCLPSS